MTLYLKARTSRAIPSQTQGHGLQKTVFLFEHGVVI